MIIFGTRGVTYGKDRGTFKCPECQGEQPYVLKRVRRFFTLYFIPLIPLDQLGEYVECNSCKGTFQLEILSWDPESTQQQAEAEFHKAIRHTMICMMVADGDVDDSEVEVIRQTYAQLTRLELTPDEIRQEAQDTINEQRDLLGTLSAMGPYLNESGKEMVIRASLAVAAADGIMDKEESALLGNIAQAMQMAPAHFRGIMAEVE